MLDSDLIGGFQLLDYCRYDRSVRGELRRLDVAAMKERIREESMASIKASEVSEVLARERRA